MDTAALSPARSLGRTIVFVHRWLGIAGGLLFVLWFASGIAMLWARMPELDQAEWLERLPDLDSSTARIAPAEAARACDRPPGWLRVEMLGERPVYRFGAAPCTVFADDGRRLTAMGADEALRLARALYPEHAGTVRFDRRLGSSDQWTLQNRGALPLHRLALGDAEDTWVYLSEPTGDVVMSATRGERRRAYLSAVPHWLYFTPLRRHGMLWGRLVIALSLIGCALAASGLIWGLWQAIRVGRRRSGPRLASPYRGLMRWHHYAGLGFGLFTFTWVLSGCLSLDPWDWHSSTAPTPDQAARVAGGPVSLEALTLDGLRAAQQSLAGSAAMKTKTLEPVQFRSAPYLLAYGTPERGTPRVEHAIVSALHPERGAFERFDDDDVEAAARDAMPASRLLDAIWLERYDGYYYDLLGRAPLPVLRARFDDADRTWLYLDPSTGAIALKEERSSRLNRWIYHGLHSFDFPFLAGRRFLREGVVVILSLGGLLVALTSLADGWRRVGRHLRRLGGVRRRVG